MLIRPIHDMQERLDLMKIMSICFLSTWDEQKAREKISDPNDARIEAFGCFSDTGKLIAGFYNHAFQMRFDGNDAGLNAVGSVVSLPEHRRGGAIRNAFSYLLKRARANGDIFSGLYPFSQTFYQKWNYATCQRAAVCRFPVTALGDIRFSGGAKMLEQDDDRQALLTLYQRSMSVYNTSIVRDLEMMKSRTPADPYCSNDYVYLLDDGYRPVAYVAFTKEHGGGAHPDLIVKDYAFDGQAGFSAVLGFLNRLSAQFDNVHIVLPDGFPITGFLSNPETAAVSLKQYYMLRVLHVQKALQMMQKPSYGSFTVSVTDEHLPENNGTYHVGDGGVQKTGVSKTADITMDISSLTQGIVGYLDYESLKVKLDVTVRGNEDILRQVFVRKPLFIADHF